MSNKPGRKKKRDTFIMWRRLIRQKEKARKQAAAYLEQSKYAVKMSRQMAWKWIFIILFLISAAGNIWQFVRVV